MLPSTMERRRVFCVRDPWIGARGLELHILCATRPDETRLGVWGEIDLEQRLWTIPAERMKTASRFAQRKPGT